MNQKGLTPIVIILIVVGILVVGGGVYFASKKQAITPTTTTNLSTTAATSTNTNTFTDQQVNNLYIGQIDCPKLKDKTFVGISGKVIFPNGIKNPASFMVRAGDFTGQKVIRGDGYFCAFFMYPKDMPSLIDIKSNNPDDFELSTVINPIRNPDGIIIDAKSTAIVLVIFNAQTNMSNLSVIENNQKVNELAKAIDLEPNLTAQSIKLGGNLHVYLEEAVNSVRNNLQFKRAIKF